MEEPKQLKKSERKKERKNKVGRPTIYTREIGNTICKRIAMGESLLQVCKDPKMPSRSTVGYWLFNKKSTEFLDKYTRARELQAAHLFDETLEIADEAPKKIVGDDKSDSARLNAQRLRVDTRKFYISKVLPKIYGDKMDLTSGGKAIKANQIAFVDFSGKKKSKSNATAS